MIEKFFGFHTESARWIRTGVRTVLKNELTSEKKQKNNPKRSVLGFCWCTVRATARKAQSFAIDQDCVLFHLSQLRRLARTPNNLGFLLTFTAHEKSPVASPRALFWCTVAFSKFASFPTVKIDEFS